MLTIDALDVRVPVGTWTIDPAHSSIGACEVSRTPEKLANKESASPAISFLGTLGSARIASFGASVAASGIFGVIISRGSNLVASQDNDFGRDDVFTVTIN